MGSASPTANGGAEWGKNGSKIGDDKEGLVTKTTKYQQ